MNTTTNPAVARSGEHATAPIMPPAAPQAQPDSAVCALRSIEEPRKKAFLFYINWYTDTLLSLSEEDQGRFLLIIVRYAASGALPDESVSPTLRAMFGLIRNAIDSGITKYEKAVEKNRKANERRHKKAMQKETTSCVENQRTTAQSVIRDTSHLSLDTSNLPPEGEKKEEAPVRFSEIEAYWQEHCLKSDAREFYNYYEAHDWLSRKGTRIQSWKKAAMMWEDKFRRDVLPLRRAEEAADRAARRAARSAEAQQIRQKAREEFSAEVAHNAAVAVSRDVGRRMYAEALRMTNGDNDAAMRLLRQAEDDADLFQRLAKGG